MRIIEHIVQALRNAAVYDPNAIDAPACVLWPDKERYWEAIIPTLQRTVDELCVLGEYDPTSRRGPAIWLRCVVAGVLKEQSIPGGAVPILYLPGYSRQDLRAVDACPEPLKPLAEFQYRGVIWSQQNGKDWTPYAYLVTAAGGLALNVTDTNATRHALRAALSELLFVSSDDLGAKQLDASYFNTLLTGGDYTADTLRWLDQPDVFRNERTVEQWKAFSNLVASNLGFNPEKQDNTEALALFAEHEGPWNGVWNRFCEAPHLYRGIPDRLRACPMPDHGLFTNESTVSGWPQWNDTQEKELHRDLLALSDIPAEHARQKILDLEKTHAVRRTLIWAKMGHAPFATVLEHLAFVAEHTKGNLATGSIDDLASAYEQHGRMVDSALLTAMAKASTQEIRSVVTMVARALYVPWVDHAAQHLQNLVQNGTPYPGDGSGSTQTTDWPDGTCIVFIDGLRYDVARRLSDQLEEKNFSVTSSVAWAALPSVTATAKPAVSPVRTYIHGDDYTADFEPAVKDTGKSLAGGHHFKKLLGEAGWTILEPLSTGDGTGRAWTEIGTIDHEGHQDAWKLAARLSEIQREIMERILALAQAGWKVIHIVTDHGWIVAPGGLPKEQLAAGLSENKWGRCAAIKEGAIASVQRYPWFWNSIHSFAFPTGAKSFIAGREYLHGGLSVQECLTLQLTVTSHPGGQQLTAHITHVEWRGMRCSLSVTGNHDGMTVDVRWKPTDPTSSIATEAKEVRADGSVSVVVEDPDLKGKPASLVLLDSQGVMAQFVQTTIGGEG